MSTNIDKIHISKARVHNLKNVTLDIPKNTLTVITGPSGSGKSSLAFDTIYVEGQRRYIESLSSYARQFLGQFSAPEVESISGLSPAIAIDQKTTSRNPRSTVGTITEIFDYLRVLYSRVGTPYCPETGKELRKYSPFEIVKELIALPEKTKLQILIRVNEKTTAKIKSYFSGITTFGYTRVYIEGENKFIEELSTSDYKKELYVVIDRIVLKKGIESRLTSSVEEALRLGDGDLFIATNKIKMYSENLKTLDTESEFPDLEPRLFSFNSPIGACDECNGLGRAQDFTESSILFDTSLGVLTGALKPLTKKNSFLYKMAEDFLDVEGFSSDTPYNKLPKKIKNILLNGSDKKYKYKFESENSNFEFSKVFPGVLNYLHKKYKESNSDKKRTELESYMEVGECPSCSGQRLNEYSLSVKISGKNIFDVCDTQISESLQFIKKVKFEKEKKVIADKLLKEIINRLSFLNNVGLGYLTLNRTASTLSGGENQRIRLATQIGSALSGVLYVLDEPSIGLHQRDNIKLIKTLKELRDIGNTVIVVEHDEETIQNADHIVDIGPGAGTHGGEIIAKGNVAQIKKCKDSITGQYLSKKISLETPTKRRDISNCIQLKGAKENNLKSINAKFPRSALTCITGVSGSGKSTLVHDVLVPAIKNYLSNKILDIDTNYKSISNLNNIKGVIELDQSPIGRTPHSNPATYIGMFDAIRAVYSNTKESKVRGYKPGRFSFNVKGGRCEECEGNGVKKVEMHFLPDVYVTCPECDGKRYNKETLSILYKGKNIHDVLKMTIEEAGEFFKNHPQIHRKLVTLNSVGLGYMSLGQPATTLSGGEAQRLKLSREISKKTKGETYILDEPTTGLHFKDVEILLKAINNLVELGHTVILIEHNMDVIKSCDYIIDLGPEGGNNGGELVADGRPEEIVKLKKSVTGKYLKKYL